MSCGVFCNQAKINLKLPLTIFENKHVDEDDSFIGNNISYL